MDESGPRGIKNWLVETALLPPEHRRGAIWAALLAWEVGDDIDRSTLRAMGVSDDEAREWLRRERAWRRAFLKNELGYDMD